MMRGKLWECWFSWRILLRFKRSKEWRRGAKSRAASRMKSRIHSRRFNLSAERLRKRYAKLLDRDGAILDKCTNTIIQQVDELKHLVNEFSQFARLPAAQLAPHDLNEIVQEALFLFKEGHRAIHFQFRQGEIPAAGTRSQSR